MPVEWNKDGTYQQTLDASKVKGLTGTIPYVAWGMAAPLTKNPDLAIIKSRKIERDRNTGKVIGRFPTGTFPEYYKPGGLLYVPPRP